MSDPASKFAATRPRLHYLEWNPAGAPHLILLHGGSANAWWWQPLAAELGPGPRLIAPDQRGHGDSDWVRPPAYAPADYAADVEALSAAADLHAPIIVGHSMGGINALALAVRRPDLARAIVLVDIAVRSSAVRDRFLKRLKNLPTVIYPDLETAIGRFRLMPQEGDLSPAILREIARHSLKPTVGGFTQKFDRASFYGSDGMDVLQAIGRLQVPALLLRGERSRILTPEAARDAVAANPRVALRIIPGAGHHLLLERPALLAKEIRGFIATLG